jgi:hypothetical protein
VEGSFGGIVPVVLAGEGVILDPRGGKVNEAGPKKMEEKNQISELTARWEWWQRQPKSRGGDGELRLGCGQ